MGISVTKLLIVLAIILVLFGTKRLRNVGSDLGEAIRNFRLSIKDGENEKTDDKAGNTNDSETTPDNNEKK